MLNVQPKLPGNIEQAHTLLEAVRQSRADDETGLDALYYLARIAQFHADPGDAAKAASLYRELIARAPDSPLAQEAVARLAAMRLFADVSPEERRARLDECEAAAGRLTVPAARRDAHFVLAEALLLFTEDKAGVLRHLLAAEEAGIARRQLAADTTARIAVLARELGRRDVAVAHYRKFLAEYQRDGRAYMLGEQLKELEAQVTPVPPATPPAEPPVERVIITGASIPESATPGLVPSVSPSLADKPAALPLPTPAAPPTPPPPAPEATPADPVFREGSGTQAAPAPTATPVPSVVPTPADIPTATASPSP